MQALTRHKPELGLIEFRSSGACGLHTAHIVRRPAWHCSKHHVTPCDRCKSLFTTM